MRMYQDIAKHGKHYKIEKVRGFFDLVSRDPGSYEGKHRFDLWDHGSNHRQAWMGCNLCVYRLKEKIR